MPLLRQLLHALPRRRAPLPAGSSSRPAGGPVRRRPWTLRARVLLPILLPAVLALLGPSPALAHGTVVLGAVTAEPDPPQPGAPLILTVDLAKRSKAPVEGAKLEGSLRPAGKPDAAATPLAFQEYAEPYGTYRARLQAPPAGSYTLTVRDRTYPKEDIRASVTLQVGGTQPNGSLDFTFPPATGGPRSVVRWLLWLVGLPLLAGVVVSVLMLRSKGAQQDAQKGAGADGGG